MTSSKETQQENQEIVNPKQREGLLKGKIKTLEIAPDRLRTLEKIARGMKGFEVEKIADENEEMLTSRSRLARQGKGRTGVPRLVRVTDLSIVKVNEGKIGIAIERADGSISNFNDFDANLRIFDNTGIRVLGKETPVRRRPR